MKFLRLECEACGRKFWRFGYEYYCSDRCSLVYNSAFLKGWMKGWEDAKADRTLELLKELPPRLCTRDKGHDGPCNGWDCRNSSPYPDR